MRKVVKKAVKTAKKSAPVKRQKAVKTEAAAEHITIIQENTNMTELIKTLTELAVEGVIALKKYNAAAVVPAVAPAAPIVAPVIESAAAGAPEPIAEDKPKRTRRTKEQIAADEAAAAVAKVDADPFGDPVAPVAKGPTPEEIHNALKAVATEFVGRFPNDGKAKLVAYSTKKFGKTDLKALTDEEKTAFTADLRKALAPKPVAA